MSVSDDEAPVPRHERIGGAGDDEAGTDDDDRSPGADRRFLVLVAAAAVAGVALRLVYVADTTIAELGDAGTYHLLARGLAGGEGYVRPWDLLRWGVGVPTAEFPPLHPSVLAVADLVGIDGVTGQRMLGAVVSGITVAVIAVLGRTVGGRTVGVVAAWLAALSPQLIVLDGSLLSEGLYVLLVALVLLTTLRAVRAPDAVRPRWWLAAGVTVGLATLTRTEAVLLWPLLVLPATWATAPDRRRWLLAAGTASVGVLVLVGAWTTRNAVSLGHPQPFTNNSGTLIAGANCDAVYAGNQIGLWRLDCVEQVDVTGLDETQAAAERRRAGLDYAGDHADRLPAVGVIRVARTLGVWDVRSQLAFESLEGRDYDWLWAGWIGWVVLAPTAVAGAVVLRRRRVAVWPLLVPAGVVVLTTLGTYGNGRFRALAEPSVIVLAAVTIAAVPAWWARRRQPQRRAGRPSP